MKRLAMWLALSLAAAPGCEGQEGSADARRLACGRMIEHVIALELGSMPDDDPHAQAMRRALGDDALDRCVARYSDDYDRCVMSAREPGELRACAEVK